MKKILSIVIGIIMLATKGYGQEVFYSTGCLPETAPTSLPHQAQLITRDLESLPSSYSLKQYCPIPQTQGQYGTCTSWASAYAFRTILEAIHNGWTDKEKITQEAFSPLFIYAQIKNEYDYNCSNGSAISRAFYRLKEVGAAKKSVFNFMCASSVPSDIMSSAYPYRIGSFSTLVTYGQHVMEGAKTALIKKAISENQPVVIAMHVYPSFNTCKDVWDGNTAGMDGYHAMCVVGYDDNKYGGAFLIMNSWGSNWGNGGFTWVRYMDFCNNVDQAYTGSLPYTPSPITKKYELGGELNIQLSTGSTMQVSLSKQCKYPFYKVVGNYISGTRYRLYLSNNEPAYVYVIGYDLHSNTSVVFPPKENISPALTYKQSHIAIPNEKWYIEMDNNTGTDFMCVLYSKKELDIKRIKEGIANGTGSIYDRLNTQLGSLIVPVEDITFQNNTISFKASSNGCVVPIVAAINHI